MNKKSTLHAQRFEVVLEMPEKMVKSHQEVTLNILFTDFCLFRCLCHDLLN